jgi:putative PIN family toxin of toxin-antitoxin system
LEFDLFTHTSQSGVSSKTLGNLGVHWAKFYAVKRSGSGKRNKVPTAVRNETAPARPQREFFHSIIIVSALLQPLGPPAQVFLLAIGGSIQLCITGNVFAEYEEVIRRPRLRREEDVIAATLQTLRERSLWFKPTETVRACADPDDDIFLECAQAGRANFLVTGNTRDFPASWLDTLVVTPRGFLEIMAGQTEEAPG